MDRVTRMIMRRLSENSSISISLTYLEDEDKKKIPNTCIPLEYDLGMFIMPIPEGKDVEVFDWMYKIETMRYITMYLGLGGRFERCEGRYLMKKTGANIGDSLMYTVVQLKDQLPKNFIERWMSLDISRWLVRTLGSLKEGADGEPYYDDSYDSRLEWTYLQTQEAYECGLNDPLDRVEDGWIWKALFERAFHSDPADTDDPLVLTFGLRHLRRKYKLRFESTREGLKLRGDADKGGGAAFKHFMKVTGCGEWFRKQVEEIRSGANDATGFGKAEGVKAVVGGA